MYARWGGGKAAAPPDQNRDRHVMEAAVPNSDSCLSLIGLGSVLVCMAVVAVGFAHYRFINGCA